MLHIDELAVAAAELGAMQPRHAQRRARPARTLIVPGWRNSGSDHWQTHWQGRLGAERVRQRNWESPRRIDWVAGLQEALDSCSAPVLLVAHSLGCATIVHWAFQARSSGRKRASVRGALLVAPVDVDRPGTAQPLRDFSPLPRVRLPFPSLVVASRSDPYCSFESAAKFARDWGAGLLSVGESGHINAASGHRQWEEGLVLLQALGGADLSEPC